VTAKSSRRRIAFALLVIVAVLGVFVAKLVDIQVVQAAEINAEAVDKRSIPNTTFGVRGNIVDSDGVPLANSVLRYDVTASPKDIGDFTRSTTKKDGSVVETKVTWPKAAAEIAKQTGQTAAEVRSIISKALKADPESNFAYIARGVDTAAYQALVDLHIPGIYFQAVQSRTYPNGQVAGNLVGFVGSNGEPQAGLEFTENDCLKASNGFETFERGADGVRIPGSTVTTKKATDGNELVLTIDRDLQWFVQQAVAEQAQAVGAPWGLATVMEAKTGKLLAVADYPSVDPNNVNLTDPEYRGSRVFNSPYEPGSTFKSVTAAALVDAGLANGGTHVLAPYRFQKNGANLRDSFGHEDLPLTLAGVLAESSNTGISILGERLDDEKRFDYIRAFGVGQPTEVGFAGEEAGILPDPTTMDVQTKYATTFGQGLATTAAQITSIYQTLGNGGVRMPVRLVEGCRAADGTWVSQPTAEPRRVISKHAADETVHMMETVVTDGHFGDTLKIPGYRVAAKSGTAQVSNGSGAYGSNYLVSMAGVAPADDPQYVVTISLANPATMKSSAAAAPVFQKIMSQVLKTYRVPPSSVPSPNLPTTY
jgi:cell division protein FtsI (penicillin-binding protein 3)